MSILWSEVALASSAKKTLSLSESQSQSNHTEYPACGVTGWSLLDQEVW